MWFKTKRMRTAATLCVSAAVCTLALLATMAMILSPARGEGAKPAYVPGEVLLAFRPGIQTARASAVLRPLGAVMMETLGRDGILRLRLPAHLSTEAALRALNANPAVAYAEPNYLYFALDSGLSVPDDPGFPELWGLHNTGQAGGTPDADVDAPEAWELNTGSEDVVVAVIDTGVYYPHEDLRSNMWTNPNEIPDNGVDDDGNGVIDDVHGYDAVNDDGDPMDDQGHGTHVAGTIGAEGGNGLGVAGVNWRVRIVAAKFLTAAGEGTLADAVKALDYIARLKEEFLNSSGTRGCNVIATNNSWGGGPYSQALQDAIERHNRLGILFIAAAGNDYGKNNDGYPSYPASYDNANILSVAATDQRDGLAVFSNYGPQTVDLGAPGVDILSTLPGNRYDVADGTSMATPQVTGAAALLSASEPSLTHLQIRERLLATGDPIPSLLGKTVTGRRLNVNNALRNVEPPPPPPPALTAFAINDGAEITISRTVRLNNTASDGPTHYMASESPGFAEAAWRPYSTAPSFTLSAGTGAKTVYFKVRNAVDESAVMSDSIQLVEKPVVTWLRMNDGAATAASRTVTLSNQATNVPTEYIASEQSSFSDASWEPYSAAPAFTLSSGNGRKTVYFKVRNAGGESRVLSDQIELVERPSITLFKINNGAETTTRRDVRLNNRAIDAPTDYMASESPNFEGAEWRAYSTAPVFLLSTGPGTKTVYLKLRNAAGESEVAHDSIGLR